MVQIRDPDALISTDALAARLGRGDLRCYDCTTYLEPAPAGSAVPYESLRWSSSRHRATKASSLN